MKLLFTVLLLIISTSIAHAEEGIIKKPLEYDVEILIFEDRNARYINNEDWTQDVILETTVAEKNKPQTKPGKPKLSKVETGAFKSIKPAILNGEYKRINNSKEYNVLFYGSWRQTGLADKKAFDINIEELTNTHKTTSKNTLNGSFKLVLARYLHIYSDMEYKRKLDKDETAAQKTDSNNELIEPVTKITAIENTGYPINMHRRMRSKELHYIDHPLVGILIQINPVKVSKEETAEKSAAQ
jgi:hypothetical protein